GAAIGLRHRIELATPALIVDAERRPEERQDGFTGGGRKAADEGCKVDDRHGYSLRVRRRGINVAIAYPNPRRRARRSIGRHWYFACISQLKTRMDSANRADHEVESVAPGESARSA